MDMVPCMVARQPRNKKEHKKVRRELISNCTKFNVLEREFLDRLFNDKIASYQELYDEFSKKWGLLITSRRVCFAYTEPKLNYFSDNYAPRESL
jgi:hypothetical protein